jgi:hypothetical protein
MTSARQPIAPERSVSERLFFCARRQRSTQCNAAGTHVELGDEREEHVERLRERRAERVGERSHEVAR